MAMVAAAVANQGVVLSPYLVNRIFDADGNSVEDTRPPRWVGPWHPATALGPGPDDGAGRHRGHRPAAAVPGVSVAGKTGTAMGAGRAPTLVHRVRASRGPDDRDRRIHRGGSETSGESATGGSVSPPPSPPSSSHVAGGKPMSWDREPFLQSARLPWIPPLPSPTVIKSRPTWPGAGWPTSMRARTTCSIAGLRSRSSIPSTRRTRHS